MMMFLGAIIDRYDGLEVSATYWLVVFVSYVVLTTVAGPSVALTTFIVVVPVAMLFLFPRTS